jgi:hypothetical protein
MHNRGTHPGQYRVSPQEHPPTLLSPTYPHVQSPSSPREQSFPTPFYSPQPISAPYPAPAWQRPRASSSYALDAPTLAFPEPQLHRATSTKAIARPPSPPSQHSRSGLGTPVYVAPALSHRKSAPGLKTYGTEVAFMLFLRSTAHVSSHLARPP